MNIKNNGTDNSSAIRKPAVAGAFYPGDPQELRFAVEEFLKSTNPTPLERPPKGFILPHAGYIFSGPVAASGYSVLQQYKDTVRKVVLLGPAHYAPDAQVALSGHQGYETPFGVVPVDSAGIEMVKKNQWVEVSEMAHAFEHGLEVQLPFLQMTLEDFSILPLVIGDIPSENVADVLRLVWGGEDTIILISSDLSHFLRYEQAKAIDKRTSIAIEYLRWKELNPEQCCGCIPIQGFLSVAKEKGLEAKVLDVRNSGDTSGQRSKVVGYGAFVFY